AERLQAEFARGDLRQVLLLLRLAAVPQHGAHDVHLRVARPGAAAVGMDRLEDQRAVANRQSGAAIFLWNERGEITRPGPLGDATLGVLAPRVEIAPVLARITPADLRHAVLERALLVRQLEGCRRHRV